MHIHTPFIVYIILQNKHAKKTVTNVFLLVWMRFFLNISKCNKTMCLWHTNKSIETGFLSFIWIWRCYRQCDFALYSWFSFYCFQSQCCSFCTLNERVKCESCAKSSVNSQNQAKSKWHREWMSYRATVNSTQIFTKMNIKQIGLFTSNVR